MDVDKDDVDFDLDEMLGVEAIEEPVVPSDQPVDPRRHRVVCKHWLRGLCKRGDDCDFLHVYDPARMPQCLFFQHYGECTNKDCIFLHTRPEEKIADCPWYDRGFCKHGPRCRNRHTRRTLCTKYLAGVCVDGPDCKFAHPTFGAPVLMPRNEGPAYGGAGAGMGSGGANEGFRRDLSEVTCFKCWEKGHYAHRCPNSARTQSAGQNWQQQQQSRVQGASMTGLQSHQKSSFCVM